MVGWVLKIKINYLSIGFYAVLFIQVIVLIFMTTVRPISIETNGVMPMHLFEAGSETCLFRLALRGAKLFLDTVMKSLGLLRLPWSQHHITT